VVPAISTTLAWAVNLTPPSLPQEISPQEISPSTSLNDSIADQPTSPLPPAAEPMTLRRVLTTLSAPAERAALLPLCLVWAGLNFGSYGLSTWITTLLTHAGVHDPYLVALLYAVAMLPGNLLSVFCIDSIGRRTLLVSSMVAASLSALALGAVDTSSSEMVIAAACIFSATSTASWNALDVLSTEAFGVEVGLPLMTSDCL
jgi:predicted MFS family arabinose efflux permease